MVLVRSEFLGQFFNTLTADYKYSRENRENLWQEVLMQKPRKLKTFSRFLIALLKSTLNLEYFERKHQCQRLNITAISNYEKGSYLNIQKAIFHATLRQTTCYRVQNTTEIGMESVSYQSSIKLPKKE